MNEMVRYYYILFDTMDLSMAETELSLFPPEPPADRSQRALAHVRFIADRAPLSIVRATKTKVLLVESQPQSEPNPDHFKFEN